MIIQDKKRKELEIILTGNNSIKIVKAISSLRDDIPFSGVISLLISHYNISDDSSVKRLIKDFMNDIKDQSVCEEVVAVLKTDISPESLRMVVSSCWQSGLNYSGYVSDFAEIFVSGDYMTAIECFTVIESSVPDISKENKANVTRILSGCSASGTGEKPALARELISVLEQI